MCVVEVARLAFPLVVRIGLGVCSQYLPSETTREADGIAEALGLSNLTACGAFVACFSKWKKAPPPPKKKQTGCCFFWCQNMFGAKTVCCFLVSIKLFAFLLVFWCP